MTNGASETSLRQLARLIGVSEKAVRKARRSGVFSPGAVGVDDAGTPVVLDLGLAVAEWERSGRKLRGSVGRRQSAPSAPVPELAAGNEAPIAVEELVAPGQLPLGSAVDVGELVLPAIGDAPAAAPAASAPPEDPIPRNLVDAQRIAMYERARKLRLENDEREGKLLDVSKASREAFEFARILREAVLNVPARLAAELAAESDATRLHIRLDRALREALETTAGTLERATGSE
jgi:hypothetical protein